MKKISSIFLFNIFSICAFCQVPDCRMGHYKPEDLAMKTFAPDTGAEAVILAEYCYAHFDESGTPEHPMTIFIEVFRRIKIVNKTGFAYASGEIEWVQIPGYKEKILSLHGITYNVTDGKVTESKMNNEAIFDEKMNRDYNKKKFTLPDVHEGSIIEYEYTIQSDFVLHIPVWYFQDKIPVVWCDFKVTMPSFLVYQQIINGDIPFISLQQNTNKIPPIELGKSQAAYILSEQVIRPELGRYDNITRFIVANVPAFREEPYMKSFINYVGWIRYNLASIDLPMYKKSYTNNWDDIATQLLDREDFGTQLHKILNVPLNTICATARTDEERMGCIFDYVKNNFKWNNEYNISASESLKRTLDTKTGNAASLNLLLLNLLNAAGFKAYPIVLRTENMGLVNPIYPSVDQLNYVIAAVSLNDSMAYLFDATSPHNQANILPQRCLNDVGWMIEDKSTLYVKRGKVSMINLRPVVISKDVIYYDMSLSEDGTMKGSVKESLTDYSARNFKEEFYEKGEKEFLKAVEEKNPGVSVDSFRFLSMDSIGRPLQLKYSLIMNDKASFTGNLLTFTPSVFESFTENPFKLDHRKFPVDFYFPTETFYILKIALPPGYETESVPANAIYSLPRNAAKFTFSASAIGSMIQITSKLSINQSVFSPQDYNDLKEFFNKVVENETKQVVLKKSSGLR